MCANNADASPYHVHVLCTGTLSDAMKSLILLHRTNEILTRQFPRALIHLIGAARLFSANHKNGHLVL